LILQALNEHYQRLLDDPESGIAPPGYSPAKVSHAILLNAKGELVDVLTLADIQRKKMIPKILLVPEQVKRTSGISANILCDSISYVLGVEVTKQGDVSLSKEKHADFINKNVSFLKNIDDNNIRAICSFLEQWNPDDALEYTCISNKIDELLNGSNIVFKLDGMKGYVHEISVLRNAWDNRSIEDTNEIRSQCLITGEFLPIARIHPLVKGIIGAQTSGASIVSFNVDSFTSYGKGQSYNAPVSEKAAFAYGTALNYLISSKINSVRFADTTMVFWAHKQGSAAEEKILAWCLDPVDFEERTEDENRKVDPETARQAKNILERIRDGLPISEFSFNENSQCYILGLAPNAARLSVRFWQVSSFGDVVGKIGKHYDDMNIIGIKRIGGFISSGRILKAIAVQEEPKNIPPLVGGQLMKSILSGQVYPQTLYSAAVIRCRTGGEHGGVNTIRAAIIKACLLRKYRISGQGEKEEMITVSLNEENKNSAYLLGRLFSLLEKAQKDALGNVNASIRDRYFGAASATPGSVFPLLLRLSRHHIAKAKNGNWLDRKMQHVVNSIDAFPTHLNMEGQGQFILGYYHQNQANYTKGESNNNEEGKENE
jgi:CRISPR-associated protein Csd1